MKQKSLYFLTRPWIYVPFVMAILNIVTVFIACQSDENNTDMSSVKKAKINKTTCFIEGIEDQSVNIPPPPVSASDVLKYKGFNICITENTSFGMSHSYRKDTGSDKQGLIILYIYNKGGMKVTWADPDYKSDNRLDHINDAIQNNCVVVIAVNEVNLVDANENRFAESFWKQFNMAPTPPLQNDPGQEYFVKQVTGVKGYINLINGTLKVL